MKALDLYHEISNLLLAEPPSREVQFIAQAYEPATGKWYNIVSTGRTIFHDTDGSSPVLTIGIKAADDTISSTSSSQ